MATRKKFNSTLNDFQFVIPKDKRARFDVLIDAIERAGITVIHKHQHNLDYVNYLYEEEKAKE